MILPAGEDVVTGLGGAVTYEEAALVADDFFSARAGDCAVVPSVGAEVPVVQGQLPFQGLF